MKIVDGRKSDSYFIRFVDKVLGDYVPFEGALSLDVIVATLRNQKDFGKQFVLMNQRGLRCRISDMIHRNYFPDFQVTNLGVIRKQYHATGIKPAVYQRVLRVPERFLKA